VLSVLALIAYAVVLVVTDGRDDLVSKSVRVLSWIFVAGLGVAVLVEIIRRVGARRGPPG
jgi:hypothetical protein